MNLELHHFFILVKPEAKVAERLLALGMRESPGRIHAGQGTANRLFHFLNGTLELLWVHDAAEAENGPGHDLCFAQRTGNPAASPFGVLFNRKDNASLAMPFTGWHYQPDYFQPPQGFHVGANSTNVLEPLCIYMPFIEPAPAGKDTTDGIFKNITEVQIATPSQPMSDVLRIANSADRLSIASADEHLMDITFDNHQQGRTEDLRPGMPLIIHW